MAEEDVKAEEETQETEESSTEEEEKTVPYDRFKEVLDERNTLREVKDEISKLNTQEQKSPSGLTDEEQKAREYLEGLMTDILDKRDRTTKAKEQEEQNKFEQDVKSQLELNPSVKRKEFLEFVEKEGDDYSSVESAMRGYKRLKEVKDTASKETERDIKSKPGLPEHEGGGKTSRPEADEGKTLDQIAEEVIANLPE